MWPIPWGQVLPCAVLSCPMQPCARLQGPVSEAQLVPASTQTRSSGRAEGRWWWSRPCPLRGAGGRQWTQWKEAGLGPSLLLLSLKNCLLGEGRPAAQGWRQGMDGGIVPPHQGREPRGDPQVLWRARVPHQWTSIWIHRGHPWPVSLYEPRELPQPMEGDSKKGQLGSHAHPLSSPSSPPAPPGQGSRTTPHAQAPRLQQGRGWKWGLSLRWKLWLSRTMTNWKQPGSKLLRNKKGRCNRGRLKPMTGGKIKPFLFICPWIETAK